MNFTAVFSIGCAVLCSTSTGLSQTATNTPIAVTDINAGLVLEVVAHHEPVIKRGDPGTEDNRFGFEGGTVMKLDGQYQMFVAEMVGVPWNTKMRLAHWRSPDGIHWERISTLFESSGDYTGRDPHAAVWSPMPFYNKEEGRWNPFYVTYKSQPDNDIARLKNRRTSDDLAGEPRFGISPSAWPVNLIMHGG